MSKDMTTKQLAEYLARSVLKAVDQNEIALAPHDTYFDTAHGQDLAGDLLEALHETGCWFCRITDGPQGDTVSEQMPLF